MLQQRFLTALNSTKYQIPFSDLPQNRPNLLTDYINATYQGLINAKGEAEGLGTVIDDEFNFITSDNWKNGKINGWTLIKLNNDVCIWGNWNNNEPKDICTAKIGYYTIYIPYENTNLSINRPKKCLVYNENKQKIYIATIQRFPQGTKSKREYSVVVQKKYLKKQKSKLQVGQQIDIKIKQSQQNIQNYLTFLSMELKILKIIQKQHGLYILNNFQNYQLYPTINLGMYLDNKKYNVKSIGMFNFFVNNILRKGCEDVNQGVCLNGIGLSKIIQTQQIVGIFKDDMIIKQLKYKSKSEKIKHKNCNNMNQLSIKQYLGHQHMRSMTFQNKYLYFQQIKQIVGLVVEIQKYVQMLQKIHQSQDMSVDDSIYHHANKYQNTQQVPRRESSTSSIIDQFNQLKVDLKKDIYHKSDTKYKQQPIPHNQIQVKRPGFIRKRSPFNQNKSNYNCTTSNSPFHNPGVYKKGASPNRLQQKSKI